MTVQELGVLIQALGLLGVAAAAWALKANHDWNRRSAAQNALMERKQRVPDSSALEKEFALSSGRDPIPLREITEACDRVPHLRRALHSYLNYYEALARGVRQNIYDEEVIKVGCCGIVMRNWTRFGHYIAHRRNNGSPEAWRETEELLKQWGEHEGESVMRLPTA